MLKPRATVSPKRVPPSPAVLDKLYRDFKRSGFRGSFKKYLQHKGYTDPADVTIGMDDGAMFKKTAKHKEAKLISPVARSISGKLRVKVLLVDFKDKKGKLPAAHFEKMLFSKGAHRTGSMTDFYTEVSLGKVQVIGSVHGWLRMPNPYSFYVGEGSGTSKNYPNNSQRMAEDAVKAALKQGVKFEASLDKLGQNIITALIIIHAGRGGEDIKNEKQAAKEMWSHKWRMKRPVKVNEALQASGYLTVPQNCLMGVCAHEFGHLVFGWEDFYDPNYGDDKKDKDKWDGTGKWDLMAGGSWNNEGKTPAHPACLHKSEHGWVEVQTITETKRITLKPFTSTSAKVFKVMSPKYKKTQYLMLENRTKKGFDRHLPGQGLLVWRVDESESAHQETPEFPQLQLVQADGKHNLEDPVDDNEGDAGDPFPGKTRQTKLDDQGEITTSFGKKKSGVFLSDIKRNTTTGTITLKVTIK
jgi:immune inhibitor A